MHGILCRQFVDAYLYIIDDPQVWVQLPNAVLK